jgi:hypothetical protein
LQPLPHGRARLTTVRCQKPSAAYLADGPLTECTAIIKPFRHATYKLSVLTPTCPPCPPTSTARMSALSRPHRLQCVTMRCSTMERILFAFLVVIIPTTAFATSATAVGLKMAMAASLVFTSYAQTSGCPGTTLANTDCESPALWHTPAQQRDCSWPLLTQIIEVARLQVCARDPPHGCFCSPTWQPCPCLHSKLRL